MNKEWCLEVQRIFSKISYRRNEPYYSCNVYTIGISLEGYIEQPPMNYWKYTILNRCLLKLVIQKRVWWQQIFRLLFGYIGANIVIRLAFPFDMFGYRRERNAVSIWKFGRIKIVSGRLLQMWVYELSFVNQSFCWKQK